jgi:CheY-like chemotaxis protein
MHRCFGAIGLYYAEGFEEGFVVLAHSLQQRRIVLVEDDRSIECTVASALLSSFPDLELCGTHDPAEAMLLLDDERTRLLIADVQARGVDALALVAAARQRRPSLAVIVIGNQPSDALRSQARALGAASWIEKPPRLERLIGLVERLLVVPTGFSGEVAVDELTELVQLLCAAATTGVLRIDHGEERGSIAFDRGAIVDAEIGGAHGVSPFQRMLKWTGGVFALDRNARPTQRSIHVPTMQLLLEGVRLLDEEAVPEKQVRGSEVRLRAVGSSSKPPPLPAAALAARSGSAPPIRSAGPPRPPSASRPPEFVRLPMAAPQPAGVASMPSNGAATNGASTNGTSSHETPADRWTTPQQRAAESFERGMQLAQEKRYDEALNEWERAAELAPDNRTYQFNLRRLRELAERRRDVRGLNGNEE